MVAAASWVEFCGAAAVVVGLALGMLSLFERLTGSLGRWVERRVDTSATGKLVGYHLGPNGSTPAMHRRLKKLEVAHGIEDGDEPIPPPDHMEPGL